MLQDKHLLIISIILLTKINYQTLKSIFVAQICFQYWYCIDIEFNESH